MAEPAPRAPMSLPRVDSVDDQRADGAPAPPGGVPSSAPRARGAGGDGSAEDVDVSRLPRVSMASIDLLADLHVNVIGRGLG